MEEILQQLVATFKDNFWEILAAGAFLFYTITGNKTEAQKTAKRLAKLKKARDKHVAKAEKEQKEIKKLEGEKEGEKNANS